MRGSAAFFDCDRAAAPGGTFVDFLRFWWAERGAEAAAFDAAVSVIRAEVARGVDPAAVSRLYYELVAGSSYGRMCEAGRRWFERRRTRGAALTEPTLSAVARHRVAGDLVVLVSDAFRAFLDPVAHAVGADLVLCTAPVVDELGRVTGEVVEPMIGSARAAAVRRMATMLGADPATCSAYSGQPGDLEMLRVVGRPHVVGDHPLMLARAREGSWPVLSRPVRPAPGRSRSPGTRTHGTVAERRTAVPR